MKARLSIGIYAVVLAASGLLAWISFLPDEHESTGKLLVVDATSDQVDGLEYETDKSSLKAVALKDHSGFKLTITQRVQGANQKKNQLKDKDPKDKAQPQTSKQDKPEEKVTTYRASKDFYDALKRVLPLEAIRNLGDVSQEKLKEFGLNPPLARLSFSIKGQTVKFRVGKRTYGRASFYLQQGANGPVSLVSSGLLSVVDFRPPRYKELRLLGLTFSKITQMTMNCGSKGSRTFLHKDRFGGAKGDRWVPEDAADSTDSLYGNWIKKLLRQSLVQYLDEAPKTEPDNTCHFVFSTEDGDKSIAELAWVKDPSGKQVYYGHSDFSVDWVRLEPSTAGSVVADISSVLGTQSQQDTSMSK